MNEPELGGVQCEAWRIGMIRNFGGIERSTVFDVAAEWVSDFCQLDADLVGAAGFESAFEFGEVRKPAKRADMGNHGKSFR